MRRRVALFAEILRDMNYYKQMHWQYTKTHTHTQMSELPTQSVNIILSYVMNKLTKYV